MKKWLAGIGAAIIAGIIVWWATEGIRSPHNISVTLSVNPDNVCRADPLEVAGYPIEIGINMQGEGKGYYIHIFHKENIAGSDRYYYQASAPFFPNTKTTMDIWLGGEENGVGISYQLIALADKTEFYQPWPDTYPKLPSVAMTTLNMKRVKK